ncbi:MAG: hypothetical protein EOO77_22145 [Oxalobacteraceae bacterium]|nr:MAG: hypothetical protein EOO77_22145 [Oxalobacteraceae bacterium]
MTPQQQYKRLVWAVRLIKAANVIGWGAVACVLIDWRLALVVEVIMIVVALASLYLRFSAD